MINKVFFLLMSCLLFIGCQKKSNEHYLFGGLEGYSKFRYINEEFIKDYGVQKIAFFQEADQLQYVLKLGDNVSEEKIKQYSLGLQVYANKKYMPKEKSYLIWDIKPELQEMGENKYIIQGFQEPIKEIDSLVFFLYDRTKYQGVIGSTISIKNIKL